MTRIQQDKMMKKDFAVLFEKDLSLFPQSDQVQHILTKFIENPLSNTEFLQLWQKLRNFIAASMDPLRFLIHFQRLSHRMFNQATFFKQLIEYDHFRSILFIMLESGDYLTDILARHPEYFYWLCTKGIETRIKNSQELENELQAIIHRVESETRVAELIKAFKRREFLRIAARDLLQIAPFEETVNQLSLLADAILQTVMRYFQSRFNATMGSPETSFCVLALGKLGGLELNYSSDIDLIYFYDEEGDFKSQIGSTLTHHEYFNRLAEKMSKFLSSIQYGECIYRVDTRLRPDGEAGPLARSRQNIVRYYEVRGRLWERQMLIKARPVAGDLILGEKLLQQLLPFIYPRTFFTSPIEEIKRIKNEIENKIKQKDEAASNVKLMAGGIRDVEFIIQALQLLNGGIKPAVQTCSTFHALQQLQKYGILSEEETDELKQGYIFFRRIEHFQQLSSGRQTHLLPDESIAQQRLAHFMEFASQEDFLQSFKKRQFVILHHFQNIFGEPVTRRTLQYGDFLESKPTVFVMKELQKIGFQNPLQIYNSFNIIFSNLPTHVYIYPQTIESLNRFVQEILEKAPDLPQPDQALNRVMQLIQNFGSQEALIQWMISKPAFLHFLLDISLKAPVLVRIIQMNPNYFSLLFNPYDAKDLISEKTSPQNFLQQNRNLPISEFVKKLIEEKNRSWLILGILFLKEQLSIYETASYLTKLANWVIAVLTNKLMQDEFQFGRQQPVFGIFAMGKLGGKELGFGSDLDLLFLIAEQKHTDHLQQKLTQFIQRFMQLASQVSSLGFLYKIDLRLRPEGDSAPLLVSEKEYFTYLTARAQLWEYQSLLRFRFVCGNQRFGQKIRQKIKQWLSGKLQINVTDLDRIVSMRYRIETEKSTISKKLNIKTGKGGLLDIEFLAQTAGLLWQENLKIPLSTQAGLKILERKKILTRQEIHFLQKQYGYLRRIEAYLQLMLEKSKPEIPADKTSQRLLAFCFSEQNEKDWLHNIVENMNKTRKIFLVVFDRLKQQMNPSN